MPLALIGLLFITLTNNNFLNSIKQYYVENALTEMKVEVMESVKYLHFSLSRQHDILQLEQSSKTVFTPFLRYLGTDNSFTMVSGGIDGLQNSITEIFKDFLKFRLGDTNRFVFY